MSPGHQDKLGVAETKLLHTLHWMLLDAAHECQQEAGPGLRWSGGGRGSSSSAFLQPIGNPGSPPAPQPRPGPHYSAGSLDEDEHARAKFFHKSMATVELFVFLFAPLVGRIKVLPVPFPALSPLSPEKPSLLIPVERRTVLHRAEIDLVA